MVTPAEKLKAAAGDPQAQGETPAGGESRVFRAALVQTACYLGDLERNCQLHLERIEAARAEGVDLIVFPELSLTGYFIRDMVPDVALPADAPAIGQLIDSAGDADLVLGFVEESPGHRFYNAALYASGGNVVHVHRKVYLPTYGLFGEGRYFARGERVRAFDTARFGRVGLVVCEDFWHLSVATIMQAEGVDVLICIANSPARGMAGETIGTAETYDLFTRTFARLLGAAVIFVNRVGFEDGLCFWGGSRVVDPAGSIVAEAPLLDEALLVATIDTDEIRRQRIATPLSRDERLLLTTEELNRIRRARYEQ